MDPFTQRMLEKAEQRSRAHGICKADNYISPINTASGTSADTSSAAYNASAASAVQTKEPMTPHQSQQLPSQASGALTHSSTNTNCGKKIPVVEKRIVEATTSKSVGSPQKVLRQFSAVDKENMDLGIEINVMSRNDIEVEVRVEHNDVTDDDGEAGDNNNTAIERRTEELRNPPVARIRDTSRNRLQRLGALYSNTADLSSPIHRTEGQFHAESMEDAELAASSKKSKPQRYGKLAALANSINQWEDDSPHTGPATTTTAITGAPPPKPALPSRIQAESTKKGKAPAPPKGQQAASSRQFQQDEVDKDIGSEEAGKKTKQIKWDPKIINSLEQQGFQRRESSTVKYAYDYGKEKEPQATAAKNVNKPPTSIPEEKRAEPQLEKNVITATVRPGLVSGRAAAFETKASANQAPPPKMQKDPTELSLKERMQLFERNKGEAPVPKAPFGMAPPICKLRQDLASRLREEKPVATTAAAAASHPPVAGVRQGGENKLRDKVAALVNATTISESKIREEINKQRQEDMQILANRFNKPKEIFDKAQPEQQQQHQNSEQKVMGKSQVKSATAALTAASSAKRPPPPPPPPPPSAYGASAAYQTTKRRSPGDAIDEESKRARKSSQAAAAAPTNRLYPALSDLESTEESLTDNENCCTTATVSADERQRFVVDNGDNDDYDNDDDENESYMESEDNDSSADICNGSLGREIMQVVQKNDNQQQRPKQTKGVHYSNENQYYDISSAGGFDSSLNSSAGSMGIDDYLDEALDDEGDDDYSQESCDGNDDPNTSRASKSSKGTTASNSFSFRKTPHNNKNCQSIKEENEINGMYYNQSQASGSGSGGAKGSSSSASSSAVAQQQQQPVRSELKVNQEDDNMVTLVHTVSFYRRQQNSANSTPVHKICREQQVLRSVVENVASAAMQFEETPKQSAARRCYYPQDEGGEETSTTNTDYDDDDAEDDGQQVQEKIQKLLDEVHKQQQIIGQTSQALNLCAATIEFSGSTESVEGERHLLVATHRRQACLDEVQRLRVEKSLRPLGAPRERGRLTVKEITVPLRQDYIRKLAADTISGHHLVCLLKYNDLVLATKTVPTLPGLLAVKFPDVLQMNNVYADFRITLEIYGMTAQREILPHDVKYHINLNKKSGIKTPKKKGCENRLVMPPVQSPAGPNAVRTPALVQYGFAIFSLREIQRTTWTLTQVLGVSPLDGIVHMKVNCELSVSVEYKGFLTMFEDISGFGAWHRRWCHLNGTVLNYWKYPDDEKKKAPMGSIDLYTCSSQKVTTAPRDICARLNTMLLETSRPARDSDQESLIIVPNGRTTTVRHLMSADTKEEREEWCAYFNKALTLLRAWGPPQ